MEEAQRGRLQLRHEKLLLLLEQGSELLKRDSAVPEEEIKRLTANLRINIGALEKETMLYIEKFSSTSQLDMSTYMKDQMGAEDMLSMMESTLYCTRNQQLQQLQPVQTTRLPKLDLIKFHGDILKWTEFWDRFEANVDKRAIGDVEKLSYLLGSLEGRALETIEGLDITNANYAIAVDILRKRFGSKDRVVDAHYDALNNVHRSSVRANDCRQTLNKIEKHVRVLSTLGEDVSSNHLRVLILNKFPENILYQVNLMTVDGTVLTLRTALDKVITALEQAEVTSAGPSTSTSQTDSVSSASTLHIHTEDKVINRRNQTSRKRKWQQESNRKQKKEDKKALPKRKRLSCIFCSANNHYNEDCSKFGSYQERKNKLRDRCFICFRTGHHAVKCDSKRKCVHCEKMHNRALCPTKIKGGNIDLVVNNRKDSEIAITMSNMSHNFLQTAVAQIRTGENEGQTCRLLLDSGSQRSYISEQMAKKLNIAPDKTDLLMIYTFGSNKPQEISSPSAKITIVTKRSVEREIRVNIVPYITDKIPAVNLNIPELDIIADDRSAGEVIDLLIGNDMYFSFLRKNHYKLQGDVYLVDSDFGWLISGKVRSDNVIGDTLSVMTYCYCHDTGCPYFTEPDLPLRSIDIKFLWSLESIGITDSPKTSCEEEAVQHFNETVKYSEGRYQVKWPWIEYPPELPTNYGLAYGRLQSLLRRSNEEMLTDYNKILEEQLKANIIEIVDPISLHSTSHPTHYLPHHMVKQNDKRGRIVYDASAKVRDEKSLNECMYRGPSMLEDLTGLLIKFRTGKVGIVSDVEKAFLQVGLQEEDRDVTRFLWVKDPRQDLTEDNLVHLRFCRVPFGIISSPFLLTATIRYHMSMTKRALLTKIADRCYVDNLVTSENSTAKALELYNETTKVFNELGMNIRDWTSNAKDFVEKIPPQQRAKQTDKIKVLGLSWKLETDTLQLKIDDRTFESEARGKGITKKTVLRVLARIYDPCGFASPLVLPGKLLFQELCSKKIKWDQALPNELLATWETIVESLKATKDIEIPRYVGHGMTEEEMEYELHGFTDASKNAYASVVYLRIRSGQNIKTAFLMSKSRITPSEDKDDLKIPKLELLGFLIGSRLLRYTKKQLEIPVSKLYLWTDSLVVLAWMKSNKLLPPFVSRRVSEIKQTQIALGVELCYVNTKENPADIATRPELWHQKQKLWFHGPSFLTKEETQWPKNKQVNETQNICLVGEALDVCGPEMTMKGYEDEQTDIHMLEDQISPITGNSEHDGGPGAAGTRIEDNENLYEIKKLQKTHFPDEVFGKVTSLSRNLGLFLDVEGILRSRGRMAHTGWPYDRKYPILIPKDSPFTTRVIQKTHRDNYHVGVAHTLSLIRKKYWIPQGRAQVQKTLKKCTQCEKHAGGPYRLPPVPPLPEERVNYSAPFSFTGLDYLGPILVDTKNGREKRWICLLTCLAVRAVHLELVKDLTAEECLLALRRFIAVKGMPQIMISDNALQFKLTSEVLTNSYCAEHNIRWKFIAQLAPWQGGFYERLVAMVKHCLKRTLDKHLLTDWQMQTVVKEVEMVVNSRPLTTVGAELEEVLRPSDFLTLGQCLGVTPSFGESALQGTNTKIDLIKGWKRGHMILEEYKRMFINQYLPSLRERYKHSPKQPRVRSNKTPEIGDIVQIKDDSKNRTNWKVGKIVTLITGKDGECRVAKVKVGNSEFTRSIAHLYPLEADQYEGETQDRTSSSEGSTVVPNRPVSPAVDYRETDATPVEPLVIDTTESMDVTSLDVDTTQPEEVISAREVTPDSTPQETSPDSLTRSQLTTRDAEADEDPQPQPSNTDEGEIEPHSRRRAAIKARERIAEWTRQLLALL